MVQVILHIPRQNNLAYLGLLDIALKEIANRFFPLADHCVFDYNFVLKQLAVSHQSVENCGYLKHWRFLIIIHS